MWNVYHWYVGDSTPVVEFATSFLVKSVRIGIEKNNNKNNNNKNNNKNNNNNKKQQKKHPPQKTP